MPGTTAAICLLPQSGTAVVVLQNSLGLSDVADWILQAVVDTIFTGGPRQDYASLASSCVHFSIRRMEKVEEVLKAERVTGTSPRVLESYTGRYFNSIKNWHVDIGIAEGTLYLEFLGRKDERYFLRHHHYDVFVWNLSYDELVSRGQSIQAADYYKFEFEMDNTGDKTHRLRWRHDSSVPESELFYAELTASTGG